VIQFQPTGTAIAASANQPGLIPTPPSPILTKIEKGTGLLYFNDFYYPVFLFQPSDPITIQSVQSLSINIVSYTSHEPPPCKLFLWNPSNGQWTMITPAWGANPVEKPSRYVDLQGNLYVAIRYDDVLTGYIDNVWPMLIVKTSDGAIVTLDLKD
jgi:hypothetical protein